MINRRGENELPCRNIPCLMLHGNTPKVLITTPQVRPPGLHALMQEKDYIVADFKHLQAVPDPAVQNRIISLLVVYLQKFLVLMFCPTVK